jgi:hypothetical protein
MPDSTKPNNANSIILKSTPGSKKKSDKGLELLDWINDELTILAEAFGERLTEERQEIYCAGLADIQQDRLAAAFRRARYELKWFPKLAELRELAGAFGVSSADGRPGPEEAWARMPKGERIEGDTIIWCEEERAAYHACRSLLREGDPIGARMAFKERYERELAQARSEGRPVHWSISAGYDVEHRLSALISAIQDERIQLEAALDFIPGERLADFAQMLPPAQGQGLLSGKVEAVPNLPGLPGMLAKMRMEGSIAEELKPHPRTPALPLGRDEIGSRKEELKTQAEFIKRSRNGSGTGAA